MLPSESLTGRATGLAACDSEAYFRWETNPLSADRHELYLTKTRESNVAENNFFESSEYVSRCKFALHDNGESCSRIPEIMSSSLPTVARLQTTAKYFQCKYRTSKQPRERTTLSRDQTAILEAVYQTTQSLDVFLRQEIARKVNISESRVVTWFKNRRVKDGDI